MIFASVQPSLNRMVSIATFILVLLLCSVTKEEELP